MIFLVALALAAPPATATPTPSPAPTPAITVLLAKPGAEAAPPRGGSLSDVAKKIKLRLPADRPRMIDNDAVRELSEGVELTTSSAPAPVSAAGKPGASPAGADAKKAMWQQRYVAALQRVAQLEAEVKRLESESNRLQTEFYAHDDPAQRDGVIKPAWDRALADLQKARVELEHARSEPEDVLNEARRDGALPGWFRGLDQQVSSSPVPARPALPEPTPTPRHRPTNPPA